MRQADSHEWVRARLGAWRSGLLTDEETGRVVGHLDGCSDCRWVAEAYSAEGAESAEHVPPSLMGRWPEARRSLRGLERRLIRHHLAGCADCRQDLELLGHSPYLEFVPALEGEESVLAPLSSDLGIEGASTEPERHRGPDSPRPAASIVRVVTSGVRRPWRDRVLIGWASTATAAAAVAIALLVGRPVVEGMPATVWATLPPPVSALPDEGLSVRLAPRPRSLKGPTRRPQGGRVTVIPVVGPVGSLALSVRPLDVPDTSMVLISLLGAEGDTLFAVRHRQWQFFPKQVLVIDGGRAPLSPGPYVLELVSVIAGDEGAVRQRYRYPFELRPRVR